MPAPRPQGCPPADAQPVDETFFRFVSGDLADGAVPPATDWLYPYEQPKSPFFGEVDDCRCHAHSVLGDKQDVETARSLVPAFKKKRVASVQIAPGQGVMKHTPGRVGASHHSWWPDPVDMWPKATVVA